MTSLGREPMICTELQVFRCRSGALAAIRRCGPAPSPRSAPDVVSIQSARGRASYRCPVVGAAPPPRFGAGCRIDPIGPGAGLLQVSHCEERRPRRDSAPDVVLTQSARGRASYRCPIVGAAPSPRFGAGCRIDPIGPRAGLLQVSHCRSGAPAAIGACGHATAMAVRLSGAAELQSGHVHALNAWAPIASRPARGCNAPKRCCKESVIPILPYPAGCIIQATCPRAC